MRSRLTVRQYNNAQSNAFKSMGSHLCTKIIFLGAFFLQKYYAVKFLHLRQGQTGFSWRYDNSYTSFPYLFYHC